MVKALKKVVLFEDQSAARDELVAKIKTTLPAGFSLAVFKSSEPPNGTYEKALVERLRARPYTGVGLLISDSDLSTTDGFSGLSEAVVSKAAATIGLPIGVYAAGMKDSVLERQRSGGDGRIVLDSTDPAKFAQRVAVIAKGFQDIRTTLGKLDLKSFQGPGTLGATLLGRPEAADQVSLYATGDQRMVAEFMPPTEALAKNQSTDDLSTHRATALGSWIYDSVLRFPGLLISGDAAASYLNIQPSVFREQTTVRRLFNSALYAGPFRDQKAPIWWRDLVDDVLQKGKVTDGRALVKAKLNKTVPPCLCSQDKKRTAGYYCVISRTPVSRENSQANISWLPRGADLSRVRSDLFNELEPWIGLR